MVAHLKKGDLIYCSISSFGDITLKKQRPCVVLEVLSDKIKVLPVTNTFNEYKIDVTFIDCCKTLSGFVSCIPEETALSLCSFTNVTSCKISWKARLALSKYGVNY